MSEPAKDYKKLFFSAVGGTVLVALCCFTPLLVGVLGLLGLGLVIPYLDFLLLPALLVMIVLTLLASRPFLNPADRECLPAQTRGPDDPSHRE
jgi:mercuric ion transport protein